MKRMPLSRLFALPLALTLLLSPAAQALTPDQARELLQDYYIDEVPEDTTYETGAGFMMYMLRKIPKRTDKVVWAGYTFEVLDVDNNKSDQILVTRNKRPAPVADAEEPAKAD